MRSLPIVPRGNELKYGMVDGLSLFLDLYVSPLEDSVGAVGPRPLAIWLHGGGYLGGSRIDIPPALLQLLQQRGYVILSPDWTMSVKSPLKSFEKCKTELWRFMEGQLPLSLRQLGLREELGELYIIAQSSAAHFTLISLLEWQPKGILVISAPTDFTVPFDPPWEIKETTDDELISEALIIPANTDVREVSGPYRDFFRRIMEKKSILAWLEYGLEYHDGKWNLPDHGETSWHLNPVQAITSHAFDKISRLGYLFIDGDKLFPQEHADRLGSIMERKGVRYEIFVMKGEAHGCEMFVKPGTIESAVIERAVEFLDPLRTRSSLNLIGGWFPTTEAVTEGATTQGISWPQI